jgi:hypothetical protein
MVIESESVTLSYPKPVSGQQPNSIQIAKLPSCSYLKILNVLSLIDKVVKRNSKFRIKILRVFLITTSSYKLFATF